MPTVPGLGTRFQVSFLCPRAEGLAPSCREQRSLASPGGRAPCLLDPLVERVGVLSEFLAQLVILLLPPLLLLQLQFSLLRQKGGRCCYLLLVPDIWP